MSDRAYLKSLIVSWLATEDEPNKKDQLANDIAHELRRQTDNPDLRFMYLGKEYLVTYTKGRNKQAEINEV